MSAGELEVQLAKLLEQHGAEAVLNVLASACSCATAVSTADGWPRAAELLLAARNHVLESERNSGVTLADAASVLSDVCAVEPAYEEHEQWQLDPRRKRGEPCARCRKPCADETTGRYCEHYRGDATNTSARPWRAMDDYAEITGYHRNDDGSLSRATLLLDGDTPHDRHGYPLTLARDELVELQGWGEDDGPGLVYRNDGGRELIVPVSKGLLVQWLEAGSSVVYEETADENMVDLSEQGAALCQVYDLTVDVDAYGCAYCVEHTIQAPVAPVA